MELITVSKAAKILAVSVSTLNRMIKEKVIPYYKIGKLIRFDMKDLNDYLESCRR